MTKLQLLGKGYVIDHYMAFCRNKTYQKAYQVYITDGLKALTENTGALSHGVELTKRFIDIVEKPKQKKVVKKAKDIIAGLKKKLGG